MEEDNRSLPLESTSADEMGDTNRQRTFVIPPTGTADADTPQSDSVWLELTQAIAGCKFDHQIDSAAALEKLITNALNSSQILDQYQECLHPSFHPDDEDRVRIVRLLVAIVTVLREDTRVSISSVDEKLSDSDRPVFNSHDDDEAEPAHQARRKALIFVAIGWITNLFMPTPILRPDPKANFTVDTEHATGYQTSSVSPDLADRPVLEAVRELGDILPTQRQINRESESETNAMLRGPSVDFHILRTANMNVATLQSVGRVKIEWTSSFASHLDFDPAYLDEVTGAVTPILRLFRYPSLCYLFAPQSSLLSLLLEYWYPDDERPVYFSTKALMQEILLSYKLLVRFDRRSRAKYQQDLRADVFDEYFDQELDNLCLWRQRNLFLERFQRAPFQIREAFYTTSDFPIMAGRLVDVDLFIDSIQPNRISSLWEDKRDMLRWYTFWAVIILGLLSLIIALVQTGIGAAQVELAKEAMTNS